jgi:hypothetical protein
VNNGIDHDARNDIEVQNAADRLDKRQHSNILFINEPKVIRE